MLTQSLYQVETSLPNILLVAVLARYGVHNTFTFLFRNRALWVDKHMSKCTCTVRMELHPYPQGGIRIRHADSDNPLMYGMVILVRDFSSSLLVLSTGFLMECLRMKQMG